MPKLNEQQKKKRDQILQQIADEEIAPLKEKLLKTYMTMVLSLSGRRGGYNKVLDPEVYCATSQ